jgi:hypothetical protein
VSVSIYIAGFLLFLAEPFSWNAFHRNAYGSHWGIPDSPNFRKSQPSRDGHLAVARNPEPLCFRLRWVKSQSE